MSEPLILLSNDDGFMAPGLRSLRAALIAEGAQVVVCAPATNQSASSHSLSLHRPLRLHTTEPGISFVDGTPADSVYVALHAGNRVLPRRPDLVVSGMNHGPNLGVDVFYSGTVAAAREGAMRGLPAVAVSAAKEADQAAAAALAAKIVFRTLAAVHNVPDGGAPLLNVNIPGGSNWRTRSTRLGARLYDHDVEFRRDPRGHEYLWIGGGGVRNDLTEGTDTNAWDEGAASVTPLSLNLYEESRDELARRVAGG